MKRAVVYSLLITLGLFLYPFGPMYAADQTECDGIFNHGRYYRVCTQEHSAIAISLSFTERTKGYLDPKRVPHHRLHSFRTIPMNSSQTMHPFVLHLHRLPNHDTG